MQFDGGFGAAEGGPGKEREAEVDGGGIQSVSSGLKFEAERFRGVERRGLLDENVGEVGEDAPVAVCVGIGQRASGDGLADAGVIELRAKGGQTGFDVAQTFAPGQWGESQHEKLFVGGEFADTAVAVVTGDTFVELVFGEEVEELGEDGATIVHKVKNRRLAAEHPRRGVADLKSKKDRIARICRFYRAEIAVRKILTESMQ